MAKYLDNSGLARVWDKVKSHVSGQPFVRYDSQSLSDAYKLQARTNIDAAKSDAHTNRNLLDNAYFVGGGSQLGDGVFPINQRGQTSYTGTSPTVDRWKTEASSISVDADGLTWTATGDNNQFVQIIENYKLIEGETYTATIDCDISAGSARLFVGGVSSQWPTVAGSAVNVSSGITKVTFTFARESGYTGQYKLALASVGSCTAKLREFKLEKGTVSTLANDPVPDFGEELRKCQRYLFIRDYAQNDVIANGITNNLTMFLPVSMRSGGSPTMTFTATPYVIGNGAISTPTSVNLASVNGNQVQIYAPTTESHNAQAIVLYAGSATRMTIANEL